MDLAEVEWIKFALVEADRRRCIAKVVSVKSENAVPKGENYGSEMYRLRAKVLDGRGELQEKSIIYKSMPRAFYRRCGMKQTGFFIKEAKMYQEVLPQLGEMFKNNGITENFWADFYGIRGQYEGYIMQDFGALGYKLQDRTKGLDAQHATLVLDALAKLHAGTNLLIERGEIFLTDFDGYYFAKSKLSSEIIYKKSLLQLAKVLEEKWQGEWVDYAKRLRSFSEKYVERLSEEFKSDAEKRFKVICHGDPWTSNMLFKHDSSGKPISVRLLDYQISFLGTPAFDLEYFFETSLQVSESHRKTELLEGYLLSLESYLKQIGSSAEAPTLSELEEYSRNIKTFTFLSRLILKPLMIMPSAVAIDMDQVTEEMGPTMNDRPLFDFTFDGEDYVNSIKNCLKEAKENEII